MHWRTLDLTARVKFDSWKCFTHVSCRRDEVDFLRPRISCKPCTPSPQVRFQCNPRRHLAEHSVDAREGVALQVVVRGRLVFEPQHATNWWAPSLSVLSSSVRELSPAGHKFGLGSLEKLKSPPRQPCVFNGSLSERSINPEERQHKMCW